MGKKERLRESMLAHKSFLLQLYEAQNREQELGVLSNATNDELHCVLKVIAFIKKGSIPVKAKVRTLKRLGKNTISENELETSNRYTKFEQATDFVGHFKALLMPLFEEPHG